MLIDKDIYVHTNVPAIYRRHQFQLLAKAFRKAVFFFNENGTGYRFWGRDISDWRVDCRQNWERFPKRGWLFVNVESFFALLKQRWGSVHLVAFSTVCERVLLALSGLIGHSVVFAWDDAGFPDEVCKPKGLYRIVHWLWMKGCRGIFTPGDLGRRCALAKGYREDQVVNAYFSHDVEEFASYSDEKGSEARNRVRSSLQIEMDKIVILNISRYLDWKRLDDLAQALGLLEEQHSALAKRCELILIGEGEYTNHLKSLATLKIVKVHLIKQMPPDEILAYYCAADIFVFPSEGDIWGLVVNEALSMGLPTIVTERIGASEVVRDGVNGYVVPVRSPSNIVEKIIALCDDDRRAKFATEAKKLPTYWRTELGVNALVNYLKGER